MVPIIEWEGFTDGVYTDGKGVRTSGVGQTGKYIDMPYPEVFEIKKQELIRYTPNLASLPESVQDALLVANYRGDWGQSKKTRRLFKAGKYAEAAEEFLNNEDYRKALSEKSGVYKRFEYVAAAIKSLA